MRRTLATTCGQPSPTPIKFGEGQTASVVSTNVVEARTTSNAAPSFASHDSDDDAENGVQVTRETNEGEAAETNIGDPIAASDADSDVLLYSIVEDVTDGHQPSN